MVIDKDIADPDQIGKNLVAANKMFAVFYIRRYSSYQDGTARGLLYYLSSSWTAGYSNSYNTKIGRLGKLITFDFSQCVVP